MRCSDRAFAFILFLVFASPLPAITINATYVPPGGQLGTFGTAGSAPGNLSGEGDIEMLGDIVARYWESIYLDDHVLEVEYGWFPRSGPTATHRYVAGGGNPFRQTVATIAFDNDGTTAWFLDATPWESSEYSNSADIQRDFGGGVMNTGRVFTNGQGPAQNRDFLSTAIHEFGHALGLSSGNQAFLAERGDNDIDVEAPLPYAGAELPLLNGSAHLDISNAVMRSSRPDGVRRLASEADIVGNAQISQFLNINLNPSIPRPFTLDFNSDDIVDVLDLDTLLSVGPIDVGVAVDANNSQFDLNGDGIIDPADRDFWLAEAAAFNGLGSPYKDGDSNLDGVVDVADFNDWNANKFTASLNWSDGDFTSDGVVDISDFNKWNSNKFTSSDAVSFVPEPTGWWLICLGMLGLVGMRYKKQS
ncbi:MAG: hypothetical protein AAF497_08630 [Planctomycetota bacterium]